MSTRSKTVQRVCKACNHQFFAEKGEVNRGCAIFCSRSCYFASRKGTRMGPLNSCWKGGRVNHKGYIMVIKDSHPRRSKTGYVYEHVLVMEEHIGRFLTKEEVVHHINNQRNDNRIENLILFKNQSEHISHHNQLRKNEKK